jgi:beta-glucosidase
VTNTDQRAGDEVVQLYVRHPEAAVPQPFKELKGFKRVHLAPGERKRVTFVLHSHQLGYHDEEMNYTVQPGVVDVFVGTSSQNLPLVGHVEIVGPRTGVDKVFFSQAQETALGGNES